MDKLRKDIIEAYSLIQSSLNFRWAYLTKPEVGGRSRNGLGIRWVNIDLDLKDYFENPLKPTDTELSIFKLKFNMLCFSCVDGLLNSKTIYVNN